MAKYVHNQPGRSSYIISTRTFIYDWSCWFVNFHELLIHLTFSFKMRDENQPGLAIVPEKNKVILSIEGLQGANISKAWLGLGIDLVPFWFPWIQLDLLGDWQSID